MVGGIGVRLVHEAQLGELADQGRDRGAVEPGLSGEGRAGLRSVVVQQRQDGGEVVPAQLIGAHAADAHPP